MAFYGVVDLKGDETVEKADGAGDKRMAVLLAAGARCEFESWADADDLSRGRILCLCALLGTGGSVALKILANGTAIQEGKVPLAPGRWSRGTFRIPPGALKEKANVIALQNDSGAELHVNSLFLQVPTDGKGSSRNR